VESDAEKRAAAKLRELKMGKPAPSNDDDEDEAPAKKRAEAPKATPVASVKAAPKPAVSNDDDEDETPAKKRVEAPKATPVAATRPAEDSALKVARAEAEKARLEATKARAEADKAKAEVEKAKLAKAESAKTEKTKAEKLAKAEAAKAEKTKAEKVAKVEKGKSRKGVEDDVETTASIPASKVPERASIEPKVAKAPETKAPEAKPVAESKADEPAKESAGSDTFRWPAKGRVISGFGARGTGGANDGINIAVPEGTAVRAAEGGTVVHADDALKGYGKMVLVRHPNGYVSVYAHNGELKVKRGETVKRGQVIAHSGASGNVTAPQLHFELRKGSTPVDPTTRLSD
jgi:murein DD-endopeptidase MepM/ murein hydrolase activator NlpD